MPITIRVRSLSSSTVRLARLRMIEQSAPWKTPVSDLLKFYKRDDEIRAVKSPVLQRFYRESHLCMLLSLYRVHDVRRLGWWL